MELNIKLFYNNPNKRPAYDKAVIIHFYETDDYGNDYMLAKLVQGDSATPDKWYGVNGILYKCKCVAGWFDPTILENAPQKEG